MTFVLRIVLALMMASPGCFCAIAVEFGNLDNAEICGHSHPCDTNSDDCPDEPAPCDHDELGDKAPSAGAIEFPEALARDVPGTPPSASELANLVRKIQKPRLSAMLIPKARERLSYFCRFLI